MQTELQRQHQAHKERRARLLAAAERLSERVKQPEVKQPPDCLKMPTKSQLDALIEAWRNAAPLRAPDPEEEDASPRPTVRLIVRTVARKFNLSVTDLVSLRRTANVVRPRHIAMHLARKLTIRSLPEIGRAMGGRDHTTVLHGDRKICWLLQKDADLQQLVSDLEDEIKLSTIGFHRPQPIAQHAGEGA